MLVYYCSRCQARSPVPVCASCGRALGNPSVRYVWEDSRMAAGDPARVGLLLRVGAGASAIAVLGMLAVEYVRGGTAALPSFFSSSGVPYAALGLGAALVAGGLLVLLLQGRESVQYMMDPKGVLKRTWIEPTRLKCLARMLRYAPRAFQPNNEGKPFLLAHEEYLAWADARRYRLSPGRGRITLYRPYAFVFMVLHLPPGEYDGAAEMVAAKLKNLR
ncbi:MAG TPA: hypothetical protein VLA21_11005 [Candidatus Limnocylindria bacterium]|nr:hypothetical protein [Candidatus Limnocylindria bacterium]